MRCGGIIDDAWYCAPTGKGNPFSFNFTVSFYVLLFLCFSSSKFIRTFFFFFTKGSLRFEAVFPYHITHLACMRERVFCLRNENDTTHFLSFFFSYSTLSSFRFVVSELGIFFFFKLMIPTVVLVFTLIYPDMDEWMGILALLLLQRRHCRLLT